MNKDNPKAMAQTLIPPLTSCIMTGYLMFLNQIGYLRNEINGYNSH